MEFKQGPRRIWLDEPMQGLGAEYEYIDQAGGYWECAHCARTANHIDAFPTTCTEGTYEENDDSQRQRGIEHKKLQAEIKKTVKRDKHTHVVDQFSP